MTISQPNPQVAESDQVRTRHYLRLLLVCFLNLCLWVTAYVMHPPKLYPSKSFPLDNQGKQKNHMCFTLLPFIRLAAVNEAGSVSIDTAKDSLCFSALLVSACLVASLALKLVNNNLNNNNNTTTNTITTNIITIEEEKLLVDNTLVIKVLDKENDRDPLLDVINSIGEAEYVTEDEFDSAEYIPEDSSNEDEDLQSIYSFNNSDDVTGSEIEPEQLQWEFEPEPAFVRNHLMADNNEIATFLEFGKSFLSPEFLKEMLDDPPLTPPYHHIPSPPDSPSEDEKPKPPPGFESACFRRNTISTFNSYNSAEHPKSAVREVRNWRSNDKAPSLSNNRTLSAFHNLNASRKVVHHFYPDPNSLQKQPSATGRRTHRNSVAQ